MSKLTEQLTRYRLTEAASNDIGIYPAAFNEVPRDRYGDGWNDALMEICKREESILRWYDTLTETDKENVASALEKGILWVDMDTDKKVPILCLNMNDTFCYACADTEEVTLKELAQVNELHSLYSNDGLIAWASVQRSELPLSELITPEFNAAKKAIQS